MNQTKYRLIAIDLDGTLFNSNTEISKQNKHAIQLAEDKGVKVVISTGRHYITCQELVKSLNLTSYVITGNGSEIWTTSGELVEQHLLDIDVLHKIMAIKDKYEAVPWGNSTNQIWFNNIPDDYEKHEWLKFGFDTEDPQVKQNILNDLSEEKQIEISNSSPTNIEINSLGTNKANALKKVCNLLGISLDEVMAIGDSLNDIKMIKAAGLGVAMANAQLEVKNAADWMTDSNNANGVARAIKHWVL